MDAVAAGAVTAVWHGDLDEATRWFGLIAESADQPDWDQFKQALAEKAGREGFGEDTVNGFVEYVESYSPSPMDVVVSLADPDQRDEVLQTYAAAAEQPLEEQAEQPFDEAAWNAYLQQWSGGWDGTEESWPQFRDSFLHYAPEGTRSAAEQFLSYAESQPDKAAVFEQYGLSLAGTPGTDEADEADQADEEEAVELVGAEPEDIEAIVEEVGAIVEETRAHLQEQVPDLAEELGLTEEEVRELLDQHFESEDLHDVVLTELLETE